MKPVKVSLRPYAPKLKNLSNGALGAHARALAWSCMNETDGELTPADIKAAGPTPAQLKELFESGIWQQGEGGRALIHYSSDNPSRANMQARRDASLKRVRRHRNREDNTEPVTPTVTPLQDPLQPALQPPLPPLHPPDPSGSGSSSDPEASSSVLASDPKDLIGSARDSEIRAKVLVVFECWKAVHKHPKAKLDRKRDARIRARLRELFSVEQLCQAIKNAKLDGFLMGQNDDRKRYDDLESLLRSASKVERLLELKPANGATPTSQTPYHEPFEAEVAEPGLGPGEALQAIRMATAGIGRRLVP